MAGMETKAVPVRVAGELEIKLSELPVMALEQIKAALTIVNEDKAKAESLKTWGWWEMPDAIPLYRVETRRGGDQVICLPRGFAGQLVSGLAGMGCDVVWDDQRSRAPASPGYYRPFVLRDYQMAAALALLGAHQGVYKAPAGSGKTVTVLGALAHVQQRALVVVNNTNLANQWRVRAAQFYGFPITVDEDGHETSPLDIEHTAGLIGAGVWEERDLTIALKQTLLERAWQLDATEWWRKWGVTIIDEVHHTAAEGFQEVARRVCSYFYGGVSATPAKSAAKGAIVSALIGPVVHETSRRELYDRGVLMEPSIEVLEGDFYADFWPDHDAEFDKETKRWVCLKPDCKEGKRKHRHRNNYSSVLKQLVEDETRNARVAARIMSERGHVHLVPSAQLKHLDAIEAELVKAGWPADKIWKLRGQENAEGVDQKIVQQIVASDEAVLLSTVAKEALDIPPIDRTHISFPMRDEGATIQLVGRCERVCPPRKTDAIVVDYREPRVDVLEGQWHERRRTYGMQGYTVRQSAFSITKEPVAA